MQRLEAPVPVPYRPAAQGKHDVAPSAEKVPAGQLLHTDPGAAEYVPAVQGLHALLDVLEATEEDPAGQLAHTVASATEDDVAPGRAYLPAGQVTVPEQVFDESPTAEPNLPAAHKVHVMPSVVYEPTGQELQSVGDVLPAAEILPAGQLKHAPASVLAVAAALAYLPAAQFVIGPEQALEGKPVVEPKVPGGQSVHVPVPAAAL